MKLYTGGYLTFYMPGRKNTLEMQINASTRLSDILIELQIPIAEVHLVSLNGQQVDLAEATITDTDEVRIFSSVDGG